MKAMTYNHWHLTYENIIFIAGWSTILKSNDLVQAPDRNEGSLRQSSWNRSSSEDWTDPSLCEKPRQVQGEFLRWYLYLADEEEL